MKIQWAIMAEGITQDARGAIAAVGLGQAVIVAPSLPTPAKRAIILVMNGDKSEFVPGRLVTFSVSVIGPSEKTLSVNGGQTPIGPIVWPDLPFGLNLASEVMFTASEYGRHVIKVTAQAGNDAELDTDVEFYVTHPPAQDDRSALEQDAPGLRVSS